MLSGMQAGQTACFRQGEGGQADSAKEASRAAAMRRAEACSNCSQERCAPSHPYASCHHPHRPPSARASPQGCVQHALGPVHHPLRRRRAAILAPHCLPVDRLLQRRRVGGRGRGGGWRRGWTRAALPLPPAPLCTIRPDRKPRQPPCKHSPLSSAALNAEMFEELYDHYARGDSYKVAPGAIEALRRIRDAGGLRGRAVWGDKSV